MVRIPLLLALLFGAAPALIAAKPPNILFIAIDDLRCELGSYGVKEIQSPNIDRLAASGVRFERAYCQAAVCNPSRASLMTGLRPDTLRVWDLPTDFRRTTPDAVTIPQHFRRHGYRAVAFGKIFHNPFPDDISWDEPTHQASPVKSYSTASQQRLAAFKKQMKAAGKPEAAFARMRGPATEMQEVMDDENLDGKQTTDAIARMRALSAAAEPFFLAVGYIRPHLPFVTPKKYWDLYDRSQIPLAGNGFMPRGAPAVAFGSSSMGGFYELRGYMDYADAPSPFESPLSEAQQRELKHGYYASVSFIDAQVGRLLDELERLGRANDTLVVLWSDHGWKLGEHGGWGKQTNYEIDTRAPLIIRVPGARANGQSCRALTEFLDIYPTLCELASLPVPAVLEGRSLAPLLQDVTARHKPAAVSQFMRRHDNIDHMGYSLRTDRHRYTEWLDMKTGRITARELYDHETDPGENENLSAQTTNKGLLDELSALLWASIPRPKFPLTLPGESANTGGTLPLAQRPLLTWHPASGKPLPPSKPTGEHIDVAFLNERPDSVELVWLGANGDRKSYGVLSRSARFNIRTRPGVVWLVLGAGQQPIGHFIIEDTPRKSAMALIPAA